MKQMMKHMPTPKPAATKPKGVMPTPKPSGSSSGAVPMFKVMPTPRP